MICCCFCCGLLGKDQQGRVEPVRANARTERAGLGSEVAFIGGGAGGDLDPRQKQKAEIWKKMQEIFDSIPREGLDWIKIPVIISYALLFSPSANKEFYMIQCGQSGVESNYLGPAQGMSWGETRGKFCLSPHTFKIDGSPYSKPAIQLGKVPNPSLWT